MITMIYGAPGAGKSYYAVEGYIIPALKSGMHVYSSLAGFDAFRAAAIHGIDPTLYHPLAPDQYAPWLDTDARSLFVLDEVQNLYGASNAKEHPGQREELKRYFSTHRHRGDSIVCICQEPTTVDKFIRDLSEHYCHCRKANFFFGANTTTFLVNHRKGGSSSKNEVIRTETKRYRPEYYVCYQSTLPGVEESKTASDQVRLSRLKLFWPLILVVLFIGIALFFYFRKPKENGVSNGSVPASIAVGSRPKIIVQADGWLADSLCVAWLSGSVEVARSCPDYGHRSGVVPCLVSGNDSCVVEVRARALARSSDGGSSATVESEGLGHEGGNFANDRPSMSISSGIGSGK